MAYLFICLIVQWGGLRAEKVSELSMYDVWACVCVPVWVRKDIRGPQIPCNLLWDVCECPPAAWQLTAIVQCAIWILRIFAQSSILFTPFTTTPPNLSWYMISSNFIFKTCVFWKKKKNLLLFFQLNNRNFFSRVHELHSYMHFSFKYSQLAISPHFHYITMIFLIFLFPAHISLLH